MVLGAIAYDSLSTLIVMRGTLTGQRYVDDILRPHVGPFPKWSSRGNFPASHPSVVSGISDKIALQYFRCARVHMSNIVQSAKEGRSRRREGRTKHYRAVGSLVVRASDSRPEGLGWMPPNTLRVHTEYVLVKSVGPKSCGLRHECKDWRIFPSPFSFQAEIVEVEIEVESPSIVPLGNFAELNHTVTCMGLKTNGRHTSSPMPRRIPWASI
ncbi:hypothetical protein TNCV_2725931 [Trichonephila clavipes]|nr:hypothetical protein TNCV_2725931 [Trichonephila clavipes]